MPSKSTFALVALLAATSVSALPRGYGYANIYERDLTSTTAQPPAQAVPPVVDAPVLPQANANTGAMGGVPHPHPHHHPLHRSQTLDMGSDGHVHHSHPHHHSANSLAAEPHVHHHHPSGSEPLPHHHVHNHELKRAQTLPANLGNSAVPPPASGLGGATTAPPTTAGPGLSRREYYEELVTRNYPQGDELLERRGILEALGLKARVRELTPRQNAEVKQAQKECDGIASSKAKKTCHYNIEKIIQLTKETNHYVDEYLKTIPGGHNAFTDADPHAPLPASSPSSSSSSSPSMS